MKIAIDLTALADNFSGIERYAACITQALLDLDSHNQYELLFKDRVHPLFMETNKKNSVHIKVIPSHGHGKLFFSQVVLPRSLHGIKADIALFFAFPAPPLYRRPSISTIHDLTCYDCPETMTRKSVLLWRMLDALAVAGDKKLITISQFSKNRIVNHYQINPDRVQVVYCGIDSTKFNLHFGKGREKEVRERYKLPEQYILSLATIEPRKNLGVLIEAWSKGVIEGSLDTSLVLAGRIGWKTEGISNKIPDRLKSRVHFTGFIKEEDLPVVYRESKAFIFPSLYEGFGLPPVEAAACGTRVVCSDIPCLRETCGACAEFFPVNDSGELLRTLQKVISSESSPREVNRYNWTDEARKILKQIDSE